MTNKSSKALPDFQPASLDIWDKKYRLKDREGNAVDETIEDTYSRVAKALSAIEPTDQELWYEKFKWALANGAIPAGRIMSNAGAEQYKPATSTINCTVSGPVEDSMNGILSMVHEAGLTLHGGSGIGYEFSTLRPSGALVGGVGAFTSGPLSFMDIYDKMCFTVSSAGGRRGAQMATFDVSHPDIEAFIKAKREDGRLRQFNLSALITKDFVEAVKADKDWKLVFPLHPKEAEDVDLHNPDQIVWKVWPIKDASYTVDESGRVACKVYRTVRAKYLWDLIMESTYDFAEPGFILIDAVNEMNNNWFCENIRTTNPCGEQPLPYYGACLLGSVNLTKFVTNPFTHEASFAWGQFEEVVRIFTRMLDNVVEINGLPLDKQQEEIKRKRRHGMGYLGLGSTMALLGITYGSPESVEFTEEVTKRLTVLNYEEGINLAKEKGPAPIMGEYFPEHYAHGKELWMKSKFMQQIWEERPDLQDRAKEFGCRFTHATSIAPTGTISLSLANNASNGIEPSFAHQYSRNVIKEGKKTKEQIQVFSYEALVWRNLFGDEPFPPYFVDSSTIDPKQHVDIQAASQKWIDSSISKTINVPTDFPFDAFKDIYMYAYDMGLKGCTTFRYNPDTFSGVLVKDEDLANTVYLFKTEDGRVFRANGNEDIKYDGEVHKAANLFDAIKENYYGRF